jgi:hypothetical protein
MGVDEQYVEPFSKMLTLSTAFVFVHKLMSVTFMLLQILYECFGHLRFYSRSDHLNLYTMVPYRYLFHLIAIRLRCVLLPGQCVVSYAAFPQQKNHT